MEKKLIEWLKKTGYPFELWTESVLAKNGFASVNSSLYLDEEDKKYREIDLISSRTFGNNENNISLTISIIIECKKSEKPFILLSNKDKEKTKIEIAEYYGLDNPMSRILLNNPNKSINLPQKSSFGFKLTQGFVKGDETCHKAINALIKSYNDFIKNEEELLDSFIESNHHTLTFPLLLIDSPLFDLKVDESDEIQLSKVNSGIISNHTHLSRFYPQSFLIPIVQKNCFDAFLKEIIDFGNKNIKFLTENPLNNIKRHNNTKIAFKDLDSTK